MKKALLHIIAIVSLVSCEKAPDYVSAESLVPICVNEICPSWDNASCGWVEIVNTSATDIRLFGLQILVSDDYYYRYKAYSSPDQVLPAGDRLVVTFDSPAIKTETLEEIVLAAADGTVLYCFDAKSADKPVQGGSWSRIPDIEGDFTVTETATSGKKNYKFKPYKIDGMVINEVCPKEGWLEVAYNAISGSLILDESTIVSVDASGKETVLYTFGSQTIDAWAKLVVEAPLGSFSSLSLVSNDKKVVSTFSLADVKDDLGQATASFARIPDIRGDWHCCYASTKGTENVDVSTDDSPLKINEINLSEGWVEVHNPTVRTVKSTAAKLTAGAVNISIAGDYLPGAFRAFPLSVDKNSTICLLDSKGSYADTFKAADVKDGEAPSAGSWSRIPDGSDWYTVKTSSKGEQNYGVTKFNTVGIWYRQSSTPSLEKNMLDYIKNGIGHVFLHEYAFRYYEDKIPSILAKAEEYGITIHIWMQCFWWNDNQGVNGWRSPVDDANKCYDQALFDDILGADRAEKYVKAGVKGIHFDYIRFGGTASKHNFPEYGVTGIGAITEFCRQADERLRSINPNIILSAALMGETGSESSYGQRPEDMAKYLDILIPMLYRYGKWNRPTMGGKGEWFATHGQPAQCWGGIQTYDANSVGLKEDDIRLDAEAFAGRGIKGVCLFREGIGQIPDLRHIKYNE